MRQYCHQWTSTCVPVVITDLGEKMTRLPVKSIWWGNYVSKKILYRMLMRREFFFSRLVLNLKIPERVTCSNFILIFFSNSGKIELNSHTGSDQFFFVPRKVRKKNNTVGKKKFSTVFFLWYCVHDKKIMYCNCHCFSEKGRSFSPNPSFQTVKKRKKSVRRLERIYNLQLRKKKKKKTKDPYSFL